MGSRIVDWQQSLDQNWATLRFGEVKVETRGDQYVFEVQVCLNGLEPDAVRVELCADGLAGAAPVRQEMKRGQQLTDTVGCHIYGAAVPATRALADYAVRVIPRRDGVAIPLEDARILWQR